MANQDKDYNYKCGHCGNTGLYGVGTDWVGCQGILAGECQNHGSPRLALAIRIEK